MYVTDAYVTQAINGLSGFARLGVLMVAVSMFGVPTIVSAVAL